MQSFRTGLDRTLSLIAAMVLIVMMSHIVLNALLRFFVNQPIYGTNELVAYWYLPIVALLGIPAAQMQKEQITVTLALERMRTSTANVFRVFACVVGILVSVGFAWYGFEEAVAKMGIQAKAGVTDITAWPVYFIVPVVFVLLATLLVLEIIAVLGRRGTEAPVGHQADADQPAAGAVETPGI